MCDVSLSSIISQVCGHPGRDLETEGGACPYSFVIDGAAPSYVAQNDGFSEVTCAFNEVKCDVSSNSNSNSQGLQTNIVDPCLEDVAPDGMTCEEVATSWVPECQDQDPDIAVSPYIEMSQFIFLFRTHYMHNKSHL